MRQRLTILPKENYGLECQKGERSEPEGLPLPTGPPKKKGRHTLWDKQIIENRNGNRWSFRWMGLISVKTMMLSGVLSYEV